MVFDKIKEILMDFNDFNEDDLTKDKAFSDLGLDSLDVVDLVMKIEEEFGVTIQLSETLRTLGDVADYIESQK